MCGEHTRESIGRQLGRSITADDLAPAMYSALLLGRLPSQGLQRR